MHTVNRDRLTGAAGAIIVQLAIGYVLLTGLAATFPAEVRRDLATFGIALPPPPPVTPPEAPHKSERSGRASPANLKAHATDIVAPTPPVTLPPPPVITSLKAGVGVAASPGAAPVKGPGSSAGGQGDGTGSGGAGDGDGDGGSPARLINGAIKPGDYPHAAFEARRGGTVRMRFTVGISGRVTDCSITRSSGVPELDEATCWIILKRFRYQPARNAAGQPVADIVTGDHVWQIATPPPDADDER